MHFQIPTQDGFIPLYSILGTLGDLCGCSRATYSIANVFLLRLFKSECQCIVTKDNANILKKELPEVIKDSVQRCLTRTTTGVNAALGVWLSAMRAPPGLISCLNTPTQCGIGFPFLFIFNKTRLS